MSLVSRLVFPLVSAAAGTLVLTAGCSRNPATEYVTGFSTQVQVPKEFQTLEVSVWAATSATQTASMVECHRVEVVNGIARLPKSLGIVQQTDNGNMTVAVTGYTDKLSAVIGRPNCALTPGTADGLHPRVLRRSRQNYRNGKILYLPMPLKYACFDTSCQCTQGQTSTADSPCDVPGEELADVTCVAGRCVSSLRDSRAFKEYSPEQAEGESTTCFSVKQCLTDAAIPKLEDPATCTYSVPGTLEGLNVRVVYDGYVTEVLDVDPAPPEGADDALKKDLRDHEEGYTVLGPGKFRLADGLCKSMGPTSKAAHKILAVVASRACPAKASNQPLCAENSEVLIPAPSKLVVLLDRSQPMGQHLGAGAVDQVVGISLNDPVFSTTDVGFRWLPSKATSAAVCEANAEAYAALDINFSPSLKAREDIAKKILGEGGGSSAPRASVDGALDASGVYATLTTKLGDAAKKLNRRAVVVISNSNLSESCVGGATTKAVAAAETAFKKEGVSTYVIALGKAGQTDQSEVSKACEDLARAGGTQRCYDAVNGTKEAAGMQAGLALSTIVADLSSCLYLRPSSVAEASTAKISIVAGPIGFLDVKHETGCNAANAETADGWNFESDGSLIRICGKSCSTIRDTLLAATAEAVKANAKANAGSAPLNRQPVFVTAIVDKK